MVFDVGDALGDEVVRDSVLDGACKNGLRGRYRGIGGCGAHVGDSLRLRLLDLLLRKTGVAGDQLFELGLRLCRKALGFRLGAGDDRLRLLLRLLLLAPVSGEEGGAPLP